jgi:hypothetical protein
MQVPARLSGSSADERNIDRYLVVHNIGAGTQIEDVLFAYTVTGHYRWAVAAERRHPAG